MLKKLDSCSHRLTNYYQKEELNDVIKQLKQYGDKEGTDFEVRGTGDLWAVFINKKAHNALPIIGVYRKEGGDQ